MESIYRLSNRPARAPLRMGRYKRAASAQPDRPIAGIVLAKPQELRVRPGPELVLNEINRTGGGRPEVDVNCLPGSGPVLHCNLHSWCLLGPFRVPELSV